MYKKLNLLTLSAMFIAIGLVLPFVTGHIPQIGKMLLPMHIPVILCGMICGWQYGMVAGVVTPLLRCLLFGMPVLYPNAIGMAFELAAYGAISGALYNKLKFASLKGNVRSLVRIYVALIIAMIGGRLVWGIARVVLMQFGNAAFSYAMFISGAFLTAIPGIIIQLILIPAIMFRVSRGDGSRGF